MSNELSKAIEPVCFAGVPSDAKSHWARLRSFSFAAYVSQVPLSDTELLLASHHLPIAIDAVEDGLQVVAITTSQFQRAPLIGPDGQWQRGYMPIALRCLPFRIAPGSAGAAKLEVALNLDEEDEPKFAICAADGSLSAEAERIRAMLMRLEQGKQDLQKAAEKLFIAGVLAPFQLARIPGTTAVRSRALTVDRNKFEALTGSRSAHLAKGGFLPIDLAAACIFSQRLMPSMISVASESGRAAPPQLTIADHGDLLTALKPNVKVDESELFSFEKFDQASRK